MAEAEFETLALIRDGDRRPSTAHEARRFKLQALLYVTSGQLFYWVSRDRRICSCSLGFDDQKLA